jgi:RNA polymerase sigma-54 factor
MEPKPGRSFHVGDAQYFVPDVYVVKVGGQCMVVLNEDGLPRLKVSTEYKEQLDTGMLKEETRTFVRDKLKGANWLLKSIYQRQRTIFRVTESILKRQNDFFIKGPEHLHPMVLKDVADELSLHESTISRVTTNKFVHTPHGIFELKYFFNLFMIALFFKTNNLISTLQISSLLLPIHHFIFFTYLKTHNF